jgi:toxin-antitoxin system PIN domain toxin
VLLPDVNVLIFAHLTGAPRHDEYRDWWESVTNGRDEFGMSWSVLTAFVRVITNPRIAARPVTADDAVSLAERILARQRCVIVSPGARYWEIFSRLCRDVDARGSLVADVAHAALAMEAGCEWMTADAEYARFPGLRWRHPLD